MIAKVDEFTIEKAAEFYFLDKSEESLSCLVRAGSRLIHHFINIYGLQQFREDLFQVGSEGLLKAIKRFDPKNGASFATYAGSFIIGEIRHFVRKEKAYYRPKTVELLQERVDEMIERSYSSIGCAPNKYEIAKRLNITEDAVVEVMRAGLVPFEEVDMSKIVSTKLETFKLPIEDRIILEQAVKKLSEIQKKVIDLIFYKDLTQTQAAEVLRINQRKVSRVLHSGLDALKEMLN